MAIHQIIKEAMTNHKNKIELFQWAVISSITTLVYSEYISKMKQKQIPTKRIMIIPIKYVREFLSRDSNFVNMLSERLIDGIIKNELFIKFKDAPEFILFNEENIEVLKTIFDLYITPNIEKRICESIYRKFNLGDESKQIFVEDNSIDLFNRQPVTDLQLQYIIDETVLHLLFLIPTMKKDVEPIENNQKIWMTDSEVLVIDHENALAPIHINKDIIHNKDVIDLLQFVTSTSIEEMDWNENAVAKGPDHEIVSFKATSNPFNQIILTKYIGIAE